MELLEQKGTRLTVHLPVEVDHHSTEGLRKLIDQIIETELIEEVEFDFSHTMFMDSAGIGMILGRYKMMRALGGRLIVSHMSGQIGRILTLSGIQKSIQLDWEEAL